MLQIKSILKRMLMDKLCFPFRPIRLNYRERALLRLNKAAYQEIFHSYHILDLHKLINEFNKLILSSNLTIEDKFLCFSKLDILSSKFEEGKSDITFIDAKKRYTRIFCEIEIPVTTSNSYELDKQMDYITSSDINSYNNIIYCKIIHNMEEYERRKMDTNFKNNWPRYYAPYLKVEGVYRIITKPIHMWLTKKEALYCKENGYLITPIHGYNRKGFYNYNEFHLHYKSVFEKLYEILESLPKNSFLKNLSVYREKYIFNAFIGSLGRTQFRYNKYPDYHRDMIGHIRNLKIRENGVLVSPFFDLNKVLYTSIQSSPILLHHLIISEARLNIHRTIIEILSQGKTVYFSNTDSIVSTHDGVPYVNSNNFKYEYKNIINRYFSHIGDYTIITKSDRTTKGLNRIRNSYSLSKEYFNPQLKRTFINKTDSRPFEISPFSIQGEFKRNDLLLVFINLFGNPFHIFPTTFECFHKLHSSSKCINIQILQFAIQKVDISQILINDINHNIPTITFDLFKKYSNSQFIHNSIVSGYFAIRILIECSIIHYLINPNRLKPYWLFGNHNHISPKCREMVTLIKSQGLHSIDINAFFKFQFDHLIDLQRIKQKRQFDLYNESIDQFKFFKTQFLYQLNCLGIPPLPNTSYPQIFNEIDLLDQIKFFLYPIINDNSYYYIKPCFNKEILSNSNIINFINLFKWTETNLTNNQNINQYKLRFKKKIKLRKRKYIHSYNLFQYFYIYMKKKDMRKKV